MKSKSFMSTERRPLNAFKNATIYTMEEEPFIGDFRVDKGVFTEIERI